MPKSEQDECECGLSHVSQLVDYPVGARVYAICPVPTLNPISGLVDGTELPAGTHGKVKHHCDDGRASIDFFERRAIGHHTFHFPSDYVAILPDPPLPV